MSPIFISISDYQSQGMSVWQDAVATLLQKAQNKRIWCLYGDLGAGKTTFTKAFCKHMGVHEAVTSPTFALMHEYRDAQNLPIYHFDFYRIEKVTEEMMMWLQECLDSGAYCLIEWPDVILPYLDEDRMDLFFTHDEKGVRLSF